MKKLKYIFRILLGILILASCDDEIGNPNVDSRDFINVQNAKATVSNDGTYYILTQYEDPDTITKYNLQMSVFIFLHLYQCPAGAHIDLFQILGQILDPLLIFPAGQKDSGPKATGGRKENQHRKEHRTRREIIAKIIDPVSVFFQIIVASEFLFCQ